MEGGGVRAVDRVEGGELGRRAEPERAAQRLPGGRVLLSLDQPALEVQSTGDRLRMALIRLRELTAQIEEMRMM